MQVDGYVYKEIRGPLWSEVSAVRYWNLSIENFTMAFGILELKTSLTNVPGTTLLDVHDQAAVENSRFLKRGKGRNSHVVLIPQPSNDPNDPLNWPLWQRDLLLLLYTACVLITIGGYVLTVGQYNRFI